MATYIQPGHAIDYVNNGSEPVSNGAVVILGGRIGVAAGDIPVGKVGVLSVTGVFRLPTAATFAVGAPVYWDGSAATAESTDTPAGWAVATGTGVVDVKIGG